MCVCHISNAPTNGEKEDLLIAPWPQNKARLFITHPTTSPLDMKLVIEAFMSLNMPLVILNMERHFNIFIDLATDAPW